jgi:hypothetical protein
VTADTSCGMDDSFTFGTRARRSVGVKRRPRAPRTATRPERAGRGRVTWLVAGGIGVVVAVAGSMVLTRSGGEQVAASERTGVSQIGTAEDVQAKMTAQQTTTAVQQLYAEQGSYGAITPNALRGVEPAADYTGGASTGPNLVSVSSSSDGVGLAVRSASGTCFLERFASGGMTYGTGTTCTGEAAMSASARSWPA